MRPFQAVKLFALSLSALSIAAFSSPALAQAQQQPGTDMSAIANALGQGGQGGQGGQNGGNATATAAQPAPTPFYQSGQQGQAGQQGQTPLYGGVLPPGFFAPGQEQPEDEITQAEMNALLKDPDSPQYKANALAERAKRDGTLQNFARSQMPEDSESVTDIPTPPEMEALQDIHATAKAGHGLADDPVEEEMMDLDIRRDAQKEAALSYGARGGLAKRNYQISERLNGYEDVLDKVFNFRALLVKAPSGLLIEPPIVRESVENIMIQGDGQEAAVADRVLDINKQAKIVSAPRDWRQYLVTAYESEIAPPPRVLWPKDKKEQAEWNGWVKQGWLAGYEQGEDSFETSVNRLVSDYNGMVRYRMLLAQGMISQPYALHEDRGVTGGKNIMRVGDRALRITGPSQFLTGSDLWKPADR